MIYVGDKSHLTILEMASEYPYALQRKGTQTWSTIYVEKKDYEPNCMEPFEGYVRSRSESKRRYRTIATRLIKARRYHVQRLPPPWRFPCRWDPVECYNSLPLAQSMAKKESERLGRDHVRIWDHKTATEIQEYMSDAPETVYTVLEMPEDWVVVCHTANVKEAYRIAEDRSVEGGVCMVVTENGFEMNKFRDGKPIDDD